MVNLRRSWAQHPRKRRSKRRANSKSKGPLFIAVLIAFLVYGAWTNDDPNPDVPTPESTTTASAPPIATLAPTDPAPTTTASSQELPRAGDLVLAVDVLDTLAVKGRAPRTGYGRVEQFGRAWLDVDKNRCDTRNDILSRDLIDITVDDRCRVLTGTLHDPYTSETIEFVRGEKTSTKVQIDHVVALSDAWQKGAQQWTQEERIDFANDPLNLLAVDGPANQQKSNSDAASWLPKNKPFRCEFISRQISVKAKHAIWVTKAEKEQMARVLTSCPQQPVLVDG